MWFHGHIITKNFMLVPLRGQNIKMYFWALKTPWRWLKIHNFSQNQKCPIQRKGNFYNGKWYLVKTANCLHLHNEMSKGWKGELLFLIIRGINDLMKVALCLNIPWHDVYFIPNNEINWAHKKKTTKIWMFQYSRTSLLQFPRWIKWNKTSF